MLRKQQFGRRTRMRLCGGSVYAGVIGWWGFGGMEACGARPRENVRSAERRGRSVGATRGEVAK
jgi:hypothetical protein